MRIDSPKDLWLLPSRQSDLPGRPVVAEAQLHRRRETTFLVLAMLFITATVSVPLLGMSRTIDVAYAISAVVPDLSFAIAPKLPFGVLVFPIAFFAVNLVCQLYGRSRANTLVVVGLFASLAVAGVLLVGDQLDGAGFGPGFVAALAFTAAYLVAHITNLVIFDALRRYMGGHHAWLRKTASTVLAQVTGWAAFAAVMFALVDQTEAVADVVPLALGAALYCVAFALVDVIPFGIASAALTRYLRVASRRDLVEVEAVDDEPAVAPRRLPPAMIVDGVSAPIRHRQLRTSIPPFSSAEMRFFTEGEQLADVRDTGEMVAAR